MPLITVETAGTFRSMDSNEERIMQAAGRALGMVALQLERQAKINASGPVVDEGPHQDWQGIGPNRRTGNLRKMIRASEPRRQGFGEYVADVTAGMYYSRWVEEGTSRTGNYPFMQPAMDTIKEKADRIFLNYYRRFRNE